MFSRSPKSIQPVRGTRTRNFRPEIDKQGLMGDQAGHQVGGLQRETFCLKTTRPFSTNSTPSSRLDKQGGREPWHPGMKINIHSSVFHWAATNTKPTTIPHLCSTVSPLSYIIPQSCFAAITREAQSVDDELPAAVALLVLSAALPQDGGRARTSPHCLYAEILKKTWEI